MLVDTFPVIACVDLSGYVRLLLVSPRLPIFCEGGELRYGKCPSLCEKEMPWTAVLGLATGARSWWEGLS